MAEKRIQLPERSFKHGLTLTRVVTMCVHCVVFLDAAHEFRLRTSANFEIIFQQFKIMALTVLNFEHNCEKNSDMLPHLPNGQELLISRIVIK